MGTRADFYVGKNETAKWIGSIAWDGDREGISQGILSATTEEEFRREVALFLAGRDDATLPAQGWPWPWKTSETTDCSYWFFDDQVWDEIRSKYFSCKIEWPETDEAYEAAVANGEPIVFPVFDNNRSARSGKRSGVIILAKAPDGTVKII